MSRIITFANGFQMRVGKPTPEELHEFYRRTDTPKAMANVRKRPARAATPPAEVSEGATPDQSGSGIPASKARRKPSKPSRE